MELTLKEYQGLTMNTCASLPTKLHDTTHMLLGMGSELNELLDAKDLINAGEELADVLWYVSNYSNFNGINLSDNFEYKNYFYNPMIGGSPLMYDIQLVKAVSVLQDYEKKELAYKKLMTEEKRIELLVDILKATNDSFFMRNINPGKCMYNNIAKLAKRYPDKFNEFDALNRDLESEREILSK